MSRNNVALPEAYVHGSHQIGSSATLQWSDDARVATVRLTNAANWGIDIWAETCIAVIEAWSPDSPVLLVCDASIYSMGLTSRLYARLEDISMCAVECGLTGRMAVVLPRASLEMPIHSFVTQHERQYRSLERAFFIAREAALSWLTKPRETL